MDTRIFWATKRLTIVGTPEEEKLWAERQRRSDEWVKNLVIVQPDDASFAKISTVSESFAGEEV
jgi:hypothetical protein